MAKEDVSTRPSAAEIEAEVNTAIQVLFSQPTQSAQAMERPDILQQEDGVKVLDAVNVKAESERAPGSMEPAQVSPSKHPQETSPMHQVEAGSAGCVHAWLDNKAAAPQHPSPGHSCEDHKPAGSGDASTQFGKGEDATVKEEDLPRMRRKRSVQRDAQNRQVGSANPSTQCHQVELKTEDDAQETGGTDSSRQEIHANNGDFAIGVAGLAPPRLAQLCSTHTQYRSGVQVQTDDAFIGWSKHIRSCDEKEQTEDHETLFNLITTPLK